MILLNPKHPDRSADDPRTQELMRQTIDFFETDFGTIAMNMDRYMSTTVSETWAGEAGVRRDAC